MAPGLGLVKNGMGAGPPPKAKTDVALAKAALFSGLEEAQSRILSMMKLPAPKAREAEALLDGGSAAEASSSQAAATASGAVASADAGAKASRGGEAFSVESAHVAPPAVTTQPGPAKANAAFDPEALQKAIAAAKERAENEQEEEEEQLMTEPVSDAPVMLGQQGLAGSGMEDVMQSPVPVAKMPKSVVTVPPLKAGSLATLASLRKLKASMPAPNESKAFVKAKFPMTPLRVPAKNMSEAKWPLHMSGGLAALMAAAEEEEETKTAPPPKAPSRPPISGYARASMMNRLAEASDPTDVAIEAIARNVIRQGESNPVGGDTEKPVGDEPSLRIYCGNVPHGTGEGLIRAECKKYGEIHSMVCKTDPGADSFQLGWAIVSYAAPEMAAAAVQRMSKKRTLFGSSGPVEVRFATLEDLRENGLLIEEPAPEVAAPAATTAEDAATSKDAAPEQAEATEASKAADPEKNTEAADAQSAAAPEPGAGDDKEPAKADRSRSRSCTRPAATAAADDADEEQRRSGTEPGAQSPADDRRRRSGADQGSQRERRRSGAEGQRGRGDRLAAEHDGPDRERVRGDRAERDGDERYAVLQERRRGQRAGADRDGMERERGRRDRGGAERESAAHYSDRRARDQQRDDDEFSWSPRDEGSMAARRKAGEFRREDHGDRYTARDRGQHVRCDDGYGDQRKRRRRSDDYEYDRRGHDDYYDNDRDDHRGAVGRESSGRRQGVVRDDRGGKGRKRVELEPARPRHGRWSRDDHGRHGQQEDFYDDEDMDSRDDIDSRFDPQDGHDEREIRGGRAYRDTRNGRNARPVRNARDNRGGGRDAPNMSHRRRNSHEESRNGYR